MFGDVLGHAKAAVVITIKDLDYESYKKICKKIEEIVRYEIVKEEIEKLCNFEAVVSVEGHEHYCAPEE